MLKQDYKTTHLKLGQEKLNRRLPGRFHMAVATSVIGFIILMFSLFSGEQSQAVATAQPETVTISTQLSQSKLSQQKTSLNELSKETLPIIELSKRHRLELEFDQTELPEMVVEPQLNSTTVRIKSGDSLARIFQQNSIPAKELHRLMKLGKSVATLKKLIPGQTLKITKDINNILSELRYPIDELTTLIVTLRDDANKSDNKLSGYSNKTYHSRLFTQQVDIEQSMIKGQIESSLYLDGKKAGLSDSLIMQLAHIFGWDIDFALDLRKGDRFNVLYEKRYVDGEFIGNGAILAAEFINRGEAFKAILYTDAKDNSNYYTPDGLSMRKAFLRNPVNFRYIVSSFKKRRFHPILKRYKAHEGVDYSARKGTPVYAAGDGKVIKSAYNKYNGNYVFIQHGEKYVTKYLHFSKRKVKKGQRVKQGQVIGLVGATGLAEAPHLHYAFLVNGVYRNPRTIKLPQAKPIPKKEKSNFKKQSQPLIARLNMEERFYLASIGSKSPSSSASP